MNRARLHLIIITVRKLAVQKLNKLRQKALTLLIVTLYNTSTFKYSKWGMCLYILYDTVLYM